MTTEQITIAGEDEANAEKQTALASLFDGTKTGKRLQRIYTSKPIARRLHALWPKGIACDPCSGPDSIVDAEIRAYPESETHPDGLAFDWPPRSYINPPFDQYKTWLAKFLECPEAVLLGPLRTHRLWYREAMTMIDAYVDCDPVRFVGYDSGFPAPIRICYRGPDAWPFAEIFSDLGDAHVGPVYNFSRRQLQLW